MKTFLKLLPVALVFAIELASAAKADPLKVEPRHSRPAVAAVRG